MEYEICYLIGESKESDLDKIRKDVENVITKHNGSLIEGEFVKKRRLSYEIGKESRGTYIAKRFRLPSKDEIEEKYSGKDFIGEMTKDLNFNQDILRFIVVKADELLNFEELKEFDEKTERVKQNYKTEALAGKKETAAPSKNEESGKKSADSFDKPSSQKGSKTEVADKKKNVEKKKEKPEEKEDKKLSADENKEGDISEENIDEKLDEILNI